MGCETRLKDGATSESLRKMILEELDAGQPMTIRELTENIEGVFTRRESARISNLLTSHDWYKENGLRRRKRNGPKNSVWEYY